MTKKKEMSDSEITKWETEAKKGQFYKDDLLGGMVSNLRTMMYSSITTENGSTMSLYQIGITTTANYFDGGLLEIDEDKLKEAIRTNGDQIKELFTQTSTGIADKLKSEFDRMIGSKGVLRERAGMTGTTSVNENTLSRQLKEMAEKISNEKTRLYDKETKYYNMFSAMESSISKSNSQMDSLYSMLGS